MLRVNQIKIPMNGDSNSITKKTANILGIKLSDIKNLSVMKQSIDARKKQEIYYSYTVDVLLQDNLKNKENQILKRCKGNQVSIVTDLPYAFPLPGSIPLQHAPVIVGMGPAGLFCGYMLAQHGYKPIIIERGKDVTVRTKDVQTFWKSGLLNPESNVQFGEGGAGTFSDGKLNTLIKDKEGRNRKVLEILVKHGAPEKILYDAKPHIGTDILATVVENMRNEIIRCGGRVYFQTKFICFRLEEQQKLTGILVEKEDKTREVIPCEKLVLAIGHSARDTFEGLYEQRLSMEPKAFAVGFRVEHPQEMINEAMYGIKKPEGLGAAPYKVTAKTSYNRGVYSFCMCPGGYVVNASSEEGRLAVNGMSYSDRGSENANSAIIVSVTPEDYGSSHPLAGIYFQRDLEEKAYLAGQGKIPLQRYGDFKAKVLKENNSWQQDFSSEIQPCAKGDFCYTDLTNILPAECNMAFIEGMEIFGNQIKNFNRPDVILSGVESRTSSPVRIHRNEDLESNVSGIYPCGEGAGYAGGITSAAMDGMRIAEEIGKKYKNFT